MDVTPLVIRHAEEIEKWVADKIRQGLYTFDQCIAMLKHASDSVHAEHSNPALYQPMPAGDSLPLPVRIVPSTESIHIDLSPVHLDAAASQPDDGSQSENKPSVSMDASVPAPAGPADTSASVGA